MDLHTDVFLAGQAGATGRLLNFLSFNLTIGLP